MRLIALVFVLILAFIASPTTLVSPKISASKNINSVPDELLIKFSAGDNNSRLATHKIVGATLLEEFPDLNWQRVRLPIGMSIAEAETFYKAMPGVEFTQPNYYYHLQNTPNDPRFGEMFGMTRIAAPAAWDVTTGSDNIVVAVIDTGARYTHQDLAPNIWQNPGEVANNGMDDDGNGFIDDVFGYDFFFNDPDPIDEHGHGTHTCGTVGARGNNGIGVTGVNWNVKVMPIKIYNSTGFGSTSSMLVNAYNYVRLMKNRGVNIKVTSNSYGGCDEACGFDQATKDGLDALGNAGVLNVFAAGNDSRNIDLNPAYPASYDSPSIVSVGSSTSTDSRSSFSNFGTVSVDLMAPGSGILSTTNGSNSSYGNNSGTSMACPHVAGAAALLASAQPNLSPLSLKASLLNNIDTVPALSGTSLTGGRLNIARAIQNPTTCSYALSATTQTFTSAGGNGSVNMVSPANCGWEAKSNSPWLTIVSGRVGAGNGSTSFTVAANTGSQRTGIINIGGQTYTVTQAGNPPPTLSVDDVAGNEGNAGTTNFTFTISLSNVTDQPVTVNVATTDGTALANEDYQPLPTTLITFAPGDLSKTFIVRVIGDTIFENPENFFVNLTNPSNATIADGQGTGLINNDDPVPATVQFEDASLTINENVGSATLRLNRNGNTTIPITAEVRTFDPTLPATIPCSSSANVANPRCDYTPTRTRVTFAPQETVKTISVPLVDDMLSESDETLSLIIVRVDGGTPGTPAMSNITIQDNDPLAPTGNTFVAQLSSMQEVPANNSTATGTGTVTLNTAETQITVNLSFTGLGSAQTAAHIHGNAHVGTNAPVLFNLGPGSINGAAFNVTPAQVQQLKNGLLYFNVHTQTFGGGEIRGQILPNPLESARFFIQQQYHDFLNRVPDAAGWEFWTQQITNNCGTDLNCIHNRRIDVSAAFFVEQEFQETGAYVFRLYKAAFGEQSLYRPDYTNFVADRANVVGGSDLSLGKLAFAEEFVLRPNFQNRYPLSLTSAQFVDSILATVNTGAGVSFNDRERLNFINTVNANGRGVFMRDLADTGVFKNAVFNRAFVLMQYFGYLRRDPDPAGYDFWLNVINAQPQNVRGMVCAFVTSAEYQQRYSAVTTRTNSACQ